MGLTFFFLASAVMLLLARLMMYLRSPVKSGPDGSVTIIGGLWLDSLKLTWPYARFELSRDKLVVSAVQRSGMFHFAPVTVERAAVVGIRCRRTPLGSGFRVQGVGVGSISLWPGRYRSWLEHWVALGWPGGDDVPIKDDPPSPSIGMANHQGHPRSGLDESFALGSRWVIAALRVYPVVLAAILTVPFALGGADPVMGLMWGFVWVLSTYWLCWRIIFRIEIDDDTSQMVARSAIRTSRIDPSDLVEIVVPRAAVFQSLAVGSVTTSQATYKVCFVGRDGRSDWDRLVAAVEVCSPAAVVVRPSQ